MIEFIFEIFGEFVLQILVEALAEIGFHSLKEPFHKQPNPFLAAIGYAFFGATIGGLSLIAFPDHLVMLRDMRVANLVFTPIFVGMSMSALGAWRARHGQQVMRIDRFFYGYCFAFFLAIVRFTWAN